MQHSPRTDDSTESESATKPGSYHDQLTTPRRAFLAASVSSLAGCTELLAVDHTNHDVEIETAERNIGSTRAPKNAILIIPDGCSGPQITAARYIKANEENSDAFPQNIGTDVTLNVDAVSVCGHMATYPDDPEALITDSAAAGTAMATGRKTYNGAIGGVNTQNGYSAVESILEKAYEAGMATGMVTTTMLTHATPASFGAHVPERGQHERISEQYIDGEHIDVLMGGGRGYFTPEYRSDGRDLVADAEDKGYTILRNGDSLSSQSGKLLGLFGPDDPTEHMSFYESRLQSNNDEPFLHEMTETAINSLRQSDAGRENGFFLMVEAGRIDHLGHMNDSRIAREQIECDITFGVALEYLEQELEADTLLLQAPDHETGGMSVQADEMNVRIGWGSGAHTGENVPIYATGTGSDRFQGHIDNTDIAFSIADFLEIERPGSH